MSLQTRVSQAFEAHFGSPPAFVVARAGSRQPDRRAHRLQRRFCSAYGHRSCRVDCVAAASGSTGRYPLLGPRSIGDFFAGWPALRTGELGGILEGCRLGVAGRGLQAARLGGRHQRRRAARRGAVVVGGDRAGHGPRLPGRLRLSLGCRSHGQAGPARREPLGRRQLRHYGPDDLGRRPGRPRPADRLSQPGLRAGPPAGRHRRGHSGHGHPPRPGRLGLQRAPRPM